MASCVGWSISLSSTKLRGKSSVAFASAAGSSGSGSVKNTRRTAAFSAPVRLSSSAFLEKVTSFSGGNSVHFAASSLSTARQKRLSPQYR